MIKGALAAGKTALDEWESKRLFASYGIPVPDGALVAGEAEAVQAAADLSDADQLRAAIARIAEGDASAGGTELDVVRVQLEPNAALEFASGALAVVQAGRPPCPLCGEPLEPTGHFCTRRNGYQN